MKPRFKKGDVLESHDGHEAYRLTRDVFVGDTCYADDFEVVRGDSVPRPGDVMPLWLAKLVSPSD